MSKILMSCRSAGVLAIVVCLVSLHATAEAQTLLRWKFKEGEKLHFDVGMQMTQTMKFGDKAATTKLDQTMEMTWDVKYVAEDGTATLNQTIDRIVLDVTQPAGMPSVKYDSAAAENAGAGVDSIKQVFDAMIGKPFTMKLSSRGEVLEFRIDKEVFERMQRAQGAQGAGMLNDESLKKMIIDSMLQFPEKAVTKGETWNSKSTTAAPPAGQQTTEKIYTYVGPEDRDGKRVERVDLLVKMSYDKSDNAQVQIDIKEQDTKGNIYFDNQAGMMVETTTSSRMLVNAVTAGQTLEQEVVMETTMKRKSSGK